MSDVPSRTSESHPIRADFIEPKILGQRGRLGMTIAPGMKADSAAGGWERDLQADLERLRDHFAVDVLVSLMEAEELEGYGIPDLLDAARNAGIKVVHFPITDVRTPHESESREYANLIARIVDLLEEDETVVVGLTLAKLAHGAKYCPSQDQLRALACYRKPISTANVTGSAHYRKCGRNLQDITSIIGSNADTQTDFWAKSSR